MGWTRYGVEAARRPGRGDIRDASKKAARIFLRARGLLDCTSLAHLSSSAYAGDPVRRGFLIPALLSLEYWIARLRGR